MAVQPSQCHGEVTPEVNQEGNACWHCHINIPACHQSKSWDGFSSFTLPNSVTHQMRDSCCMARCTGKWGGMGSTGAVLPPPLQMIPLALVPSNKQPKRLPQGCPQHQTSTEWSPCSKRPLTLCHVYCLPDAAQDTASPSLLSAPTISPPLLLRFRPSRCWVVRLSSRETLKVPPWTPVAVCTLWVWSLCQVNAAALTPSAPLYEQPRTHRWRALLSHSQAHTRPHPSKAQSKTQSCLYTNIPERRNHMWQMLLHCLMHHLKPFGDCMAVMSNLARILSRDHTVWIRALWRSLAGLKARKLC